MIEVPVRFGQHDDLLLIHENDTGCLKINQCESNSNFEIYTYHNSLDLWYVWEFKFYLKDLRMRGSKLMACVQKSLADDYTCNLTKTSLIFNLRGHIYIHCFIHFVKTYNYQGCIQFRHIVE